MLATILYLLLGLVVLFVVIGFFLPREITVERSTGITQPAAAIFPWIADLKKWPDWTVWNKSEDPTLSYTYPGPTTGKGGSMHWTAKKMGDGSLTITALEPDKALRYELRMAGQSMVVRGNLELEPAGGGVTLVMWFDNIDLGASPLKRWSGPLLNKMLGRAFERSLAGLKTAVESGAASGPGPM